MNQAEIVNFFPAYGQPAGGAGITAQDWEDSSPDTGIVIAGSAGNVTLERTSGGSWSHFSSDDSSGSAGDPVAVSFKKNQMGTTAKLGGLATAHPAEITNVEHALIISGSGGSELLRYRPDGNSGNDVVSATSAITGDEVKIEYVPGEDGGTLKFYKNDVEVTDLKQTGIGSNENFIGVATNSTSSAGIPSHTELKIWR